jgi:hypothetical protein
MTEQQNPPGKVVNWPLIACHCVALPLELLLHDIRSFGVRSVGPRVPGALILIFVFLAGYQGDNLVPLIGLMIAVFVMGLIARLSAIRLWNTKS